MWQIRGASQLPDTIRVWDAATGKLATAPLNSENVFQGGEACWESAVALSSDCRYLAGLRPDGTVTLFDIDARQPLGEPLWRADNSDQSERYVLGGTLEYLNDGKILAAARGKHIVLLDTDIESWKSKACKKANRNLTEDEWKRYIGPETPYEKTCPELP
jgi:hypothetical protein